MRLAEYLVAVHGEIGEEGNKWTLKRRMLALKVIAVKLWDRRCECAWVVGGVGRAFHQHRQLF
jgi:hypothetical protein